MGLEPGTFRIQSEHAKRLAIGADKYRSPKGESILPECVVKSYLYHLVDVVKMFCHLIHFNNSVQSANVWNKSNSETIQIFYEKNTRQNF